jgi:hypothetical protein
MESGLGMTLTATYSSAYSAFDLVKLVVGEKGGKVREREARRLAVQHRLQNPEVEARGEAHARLAQFGGEAGRRTEYQGKLLEGGSLKFFVKVSPWTFLLKFLVLGIP